MTQVKEHIGGQAVLEGVMIRSKEKTAVAVRKKDGTVVQKVDDLRSLTTNKILGLPFIRGVVSLGEMLYIGINALLWSAMQQEDGEAIKKGELTITVIFSLLAAIGLFVLLPYGLSKIFVSEDGFLFSLVDGAFRIGIFFGYLWIISRTKDIKRVFEYHGAEHMTIHCYEKGEELTVEKVKNYPPEHPRCGTSFILIVLIVSVIIFSFVKLDFWLSNIALRLSLVPVIGGISYELLKLGGKYEESRFFKILLLPGMLTQKITTKNPKDDQIEVAIEAVKAVV